MGLWPLPGGKDKYIETALACLSFVNENNPTYDEFRKWFVDKYHLSGGKSTDGYIYVITSQIPLIEERDGRLTLTNHGKQYLQTRNARVFYELLDKEIAGIEDILSMLYAEPASTSKIHRNLVSKLNPRWKTTAPTLWRVNWLLSLGLVRKTRGLVELTDAGRSLIEEKGPPKPAPRYKVGEVLSHKEYGKVKIVSMRFSDGKWFYEVERIVGENR